MHIYILKQGFRSHGPHTPPHLGDSVHRIEQLWVAGSHLCLRLPRSLLVLLASPEYLHQWYRLVPRDLLLTVKNLNRRLLVSQVLLNGYSFHGGTTGKLVSCDDYLQEMLDTIAKVYFLRGVLVRLANIVFVFATNSSAITTVLQNVANNFFYNDLIQMSQINLLL
jgi:hypothetical protein